jgi:hypothetical protein
MTEREFAVSTSLSIEDVNSGLQELVNLFLDVPKDVNTEINIDADKSVIETVKNDLEDIQGYKAIASVDVDDTEASSVINEIKSELDVIDGDTVQATISAEDDASSVVDAINNKLDELDGVTNIVLTGDDEASPVIEQVKTELDSIPTEVNITITADDSGVTEATDSTNDLTSAITSAAGGIGLYKFGMDGLNFQNYIGQAQAYTSATAQQRAEMEKTVKENSSAKYKVNELADAYKWLAIQTGDANTSNSLFATELSYIKQNSADLTGGITGLTKLYQLYGLNSEEAADATAVFNAEILKTGYSGDQFLQLVQRSSLDLANMGFTMQETGAIVSAFGRSGIDAASAQRMLRGGFNEFIKEFDEGNPKIAEYEQKIQAAGVATRDANGNLRPAKDVLSDLMEAFARMPEGPEKTRLAMELFGTSAGKVMGNLKVDYKDVEKEAQSSAQGQIDAAKKVRTETQDPLQWLMNELQKLTATWGITASQIASYAGILLGGYGAWKLAGERLLSAILPEDANVKVDRFFSELKSDLNNKLADLREKVFGGDKAKFEIKITEDPQGNTVIEEAKINGFVDRVKAKINELKTSRFKLSDIFGGEDSTILDTLKIKVETTVDTIKGKWDTLKGKLKISDWFKDEKGAVNTEFGGQIIDDIITKINEKIPKLKGLGEKIPDELLKGIKEKIPNLSQIGDKIPEEIYTGFKAGIPRLISRIGGDGPLIAIGIIQMLSTNLKEYWKKSFLELFLEGIDPLGFWTAIFGKLFEPMAKIFEIIGISKITPEMLLNKIFGEDAVKGFEDWWEKNVFLPMKAQLDLFFNDPVKYLFGDKAQSLNIVDLIFGKKKEGKDEKDPLTVFIDDAKKKVEGFLKWLGTLNPINLIDIIMGKKKDEKGNETEDPLTKFIIDSKTKLKGFIDWIGTLKPPNIIEIIFGKTGEKKEDPLTNYVNEIKTKLQEFKDWLQGKFNEIKGITKIEWSKIYEGLPEAKQWVMDRINELKNYIKERKDEIEGYLKFKWDEIEKGLKEAQQWVYNKWDDFKKFMEDLPPKAKKWGGDIVQGLIDGIMGKIPGLETALNFIKKYFPQSPPEKGPLSDITASKSAGWINDVFVNPVNYQLGNVGSALGGLWDNYWSGYENWRSTHYPGPSPGTMNWTSGGAWTNEVGGSSAPSGWEQNPLNWNTDTITNWDNTLGDTIPGLGNFTEAIGKATLGMANWNAGQPSIGWAGGWNAGQPGLMGVNGWNAGQPTLGGAVSNWNAGLAALNSAAHRPNAGQAALRHVDETPIPLPANQQQVPTGHWERSTQKVNITFESGAFQGVDYQTSTKRAAMEGVGMGLELARQSHMKGFKPRNVKL